jgi:hypothetical protein
MQTFTSKNKNCVISPAQQSQKQNKTLVMKKETKKGNEK